MRLLRPAVLLLLLLSASSPAPAKIVIARHDADVVLDPARGWLEVEDMVTLRVGVDLPGRPDRDEYDMESLKDVHLLLNRNLEVRRIERREGGDWIELPRAGEVEEFPESDGAWDAFPTVDPRFFSPDPDSFELEFFDRCQEVVVSPPFPAGWVQPCRIRLTYAGVIYDSLRAPQTTYARSFATSSGLIDTAGAYLGGETAWLPTKLYDLFQFELTVDLPAHWRSVSQGFLKSDELGDDRRRESWYCSHPMQEAYLVAGPYVVVRDTVRAAREVPGLSPEAASAHRVEIATYLYRPDPDLSQRYLAATRRYLQRFSSSIGLYPYRKFYLVENFWQTGYGMPSFTLLGDRVIRLPFIIDTSYGHEILHNWWGNGVFIDPRRGNWCEGITTYGADYSFAEEKGEAAAREYRQGVLRDYLNYVREETDFPLTEFTSRSSPVTQNVGYGKTMMVFHMLRRRLGDELFRKSLSRFFRKNLYRVAGWEELISPFEESSGEDLAWFVDQWVRQPGAPLLELAGARLEPPPEGAAAPEGRHRVTAVITQSAPPYRMRVPVVIAGEEGDTTLTIEMTEDRHELEVEVSWPPLSLAVDPDFHCFRRVHRSEIPATLSQTLGADSTLILLPTEGSAELRRAFGELAEGWKSSEEGIRVMEGEVAPEDLAGYGVWILGESRLARELLAGLPSPIRISPDEWVLEGERYSPAGHTLIITGARAENPDLSWTWFMTEDAAAVESLGRKLPHYGKYTYLLFQGTRNVGKGIVYPPTSPLTVEF